MNPPIPNAGIRLERKHPLAIRWMHWINFPVHLRDDLERTLHLLERFGQRVQASA